MCVTACNAKLVIGPAVVKPDELNAAVRIKVDKIAIRRRARDPRKYTNAPLIAVRQAVNLLFENAPSSYIAGQQQGLTAAGRGGDRCTV